MSSNAPSQIKFHRHSQILEVRYEQHGVFELPSEYLRVFSPSAEVKGHGPGQEVLQLDKENVAIKGIEAQGNYAIKIVFSDGHDSGIYTWQYLAELGLNYESNWETYLAEVKEHKANEGVSAVKWVQPD